MRKIFKLRGMGMVEPGIKCNATPFEEIKLALLCILAGLVSGFAAVIFRYLVGLFNNIFWHHGAHAFKGLGNIYKFLIPVVGLLIVSTFIKISLRKGEDHGVQEVIKTIALRGGKISPRIAPIEALASSICIGAGGSVGPEGPMVQIGAGIGSTIGQVFKLHPAKLIQLTAAGAAGGLAAIFNAPVAGVIFAMEAILAKFHTKSFCYLALASVTALQLRKLIMGTEPLLDLSSASFSNTYGLILFILVGISGGIISGLFMKMLNVTEAFFKSLNAPYLLNALLGGTVLGIFALYLPQVLGEGYEYMEQVFNKEHIFTFIFIMLGVKIFATAITINSGGSGGFFAPALYFGVMLGGLFSSYFGGINIEIVSHEAFIAAGMASILAGVFQSPITAIIMIAEIANCYHLVLPLMLVSVVSTYVNSMFYKGRSVYDMKLVKDGIKKLEPNLYFPNSSLKEMVKRS
ncbi:MAG: chloride channel protein [Clostridia bacterium]|nr:chloride channel protein [Clostridia bacterium]